jgi:hypothetical protein
VSANYYRSEDLSASGPWYPHTEILLKQCHRIRHSDLYVMENWFDTEEIHELIPNTLNSCSLIPVRNRKVNVNVSPAIIEDDSLTHSMRKPIIRETRLKLYSPFWKERGMKPWRLDCSGSRSRRSKSKWSSTNSQEWSQLCCFLFSLRNSTEP